MLIPNILPLLCLRFPCIPVTYTQRHDFTLEKCAQFLAFFEKCPLCVTHCLNEQYWFLLFLKELMMLSTEQKFFTVNQICCFETLLFIFYTKDNAALKWYILYHKASDEIRNLSKCFFFFSFREKW